MENKNKGVVIGAITRKQVRNFLRKEVGNKELAVHWREYQTKVHGEENLLALWPRWKRKNFHAERAFLTRMDKKATE